MRRVLLDEDVPRALRREFPEFAIRTAQEEHWSSVKNGELLRRGSPLFDVLVTADKRLQYQQNVSQHAIGVVVIGTRDTRLPRLLQPEVLDELRAAIRNVAPGTVIVVKGAE